MDFNDSAEEAVFRAEVRSWLAENAIPETELEGLDTLERFRKWTSRKAEGGWSCLGWPEQYGGRNATPIQEVIWQQEEARFPHLQSNRFKVGIGLVAPTLMRYFKDRADVLERLLPPISRGEEIWVQLFSEPAAGSDLAALRTKAERDGDEWVVNGQKIWSSYAVEAKWGLLVVRTDPTVAKHAGLTFFYVDMDTPGIDVRPIKQINGESEFNEVFLTDVRIPDSNRIGELGKGWEVALTALSHERLDMGGENYGIDYSVLYKLASELEIDGRPAIEHGHVKAKLADFYCVEAGLRAGTNRVISALSQGKQPGPETSINKMVIGNTIQEMTAFVLDLMDQAGVVLSGSIENESLMQYVYMSIPSFRLAGGTDEIQANLVAESVLGLPREARVDKNIPFNEIPVGK